MKLRGEKISLRHLLRNIHPTISQTMHSDILREDIGKMDILPIFLCTLREKQKNCYDDK